MAYKLGMVITFFNGQKYQNVFHNIGRKGGRKEGKKKGRKGFNH
jgi:hypothetical protein